MKQSRPTSATSACLIYDPTFEQLLLHVCRPETPTCPLSIFTTMRKCSAKAPFCMSATAHPRGYDKLRIWDLSFVLFSQLTNDTPPTITILVPRITLPFDRFHQHTHQSCFLHLHHRCPSVTTPRQECNHPQSRFAYESMFPVTTIQKPPLHNLRSVRGSTEKYSICPETNGPRTKRQPSRFDSENDDYCVKSFSTALIQDIDTFRKRNNKNTYFRLLY